jgi:hypothetical protein
MELTVLAVPGCPNVEVMAKRLGIAAAGLPDVTVVRRVVRDERQAAALGMRGSPTLLIDGADPFAAVSQPTGLGCRLFPHADGSLRGAPSVGSLRRALEQAVPPERIAGQTHPSRPELITRRAFRGMSGQSIRV